MNLDRWPLQATRSEPSSPRRPVSPIHNLISSTKVVELRHTHLVFTPRDFTNQRASLRLKNSNTGRPAEECQDRPSGWGIGHDSPATTPTGPPVLSRPASRRPIRPRRPHRPPAAIRRPLHRDHPRRSLRYAAVGLRRHLSRAHATRWIPDHRSASHRDLPHGESQC